MANAIQSGCSLTIVGKPAASLHNWDARTDVSLPPRLRRDYVVGKGARIGNDCHRFDLSAIDVGGSTEGHADHVDHGESAAQSRKDVTSWHVAPLLAPTTHVADMRPDPVLCSAVPVQVLATTEHTASRNPSIQVVT